MSPVIEIPQHLLIVLLAVLEPGTPADRVQGSATLHPAMQQVAASVHANPYQFAHEPFFDALAGQRGDARFAPFARRVFKTSSGQAYVPVMREAKTILALRRDPMIARHLAERYAQANAVALHEALGRKVTLADLYLAHRVGLRFALEILNFARSEPRARAALMLPDLDEVAPSLVFMGDRATSFSEIVTAVGQAVARARSGYDAQRPPPLPGRSRRDMLRAAASQAARRSPVGAKSDSARSVRNWQTQIVPRDRTLASAR